MPVPLWRRLKATNDPDQLKKDFPFMKSTAVFQLAYQKPGDDGLLHSTANAHETQWDVTDLTTGIATTRTLLPASAARSTHTVISGCATSPSTPSR
ncbi:hypothetical protein ACGFR8_15805 [Streptomyces brevispora]|uniref:hypothetical protein n=1 Tax=Streptomyces brevispora TaxID=887462 RepID=UPI00371CF166